MFRTKAKGTRLYRPLSKDQIFQIIDGAVKCRDAVLITILYTQALRISELLNLHVEDFYWDSDELHVHKGKGDKDRLIALHPLARDAAIIYLRRAGISEGLIFEGLCKRQATKIICDLAVETGVEDPNHGFHVHTHSFRHARATHLSQAGVNLRVVQQILGHADLGMTAHYLDYDTSEQARQIPEAVFDDPATVPKPMPVPFWEEPAFRIINT